MKLFTTIYLFLFSLAAANAQVAISARYVSNSSSAFENLDPELEFRSGYELGLGYWFRLKNKRMEFTPEISYSNYSADALSTTAISFNGNILIYPLDFHSDCNSCPTFSKDGGLIKKGFYWLLSPGLTQVNHNNPFILESLRKTLTYRMGVGLGLDIGITNLMTLSPFVMYNVTGDAFNYNIDLMSSETEAGSLSQIHLGIRSTFRFDKNKW